MTTEILKLDNVSKTFGDGDTSITVLRDISFSLQKGEFIAIVGPSGSGKSTLLSIIGALLTPSSGNIVIDNQNITAYRSKKLSSVRAEKIGFIFQSAHLLPYLTVKDQLVLISDLSKKNKKESSKKAIDFLKNLGLKHRIHAYPNKLSGGEKQRVAIARALMNDPEIILADEPTASLDSTRGRQVVELISQEVKSRNKAAVMVTHDERILDVCDRILYMEDGQISFDEIKNMEGVVQKAGKNR